ncbi:hypothetical protein AJ79_08635 [Helicocarpus griseus UAMH5409]|uniref:Zn(2)-C6 fungal-type domain-containing protein n=1 Tax=Helicocarpus griseus UAMH5409 TaxID=1447875 RepID=A0A2B7WIN7_9EURO|nr:hypothetical protein AJ79_08635 [Helicocarpus griseus UAMH5409]
MEVNNKRRVPLDKRKRTEISCDKCKSRKQKCDRLRGQSQCRYCQINNIVCSTTQPRKQRIYGSDETLRNRLTILESLVKGLLPDANLSNNNEMLKLGKNLGIPLPIDESAADTEKKGKVSDSQDDEYSVSLFPDQQGQIQYIGPSSSFEFHRKLRMLLGSYVTYEFAMFGRNAADQPSTPEMPGIAQMGGGKDRRGNSELGSVPSDCGSLSNLLRKNDGPFLDSLVDAYFDIIHSDFPVLHETSFREAYEIWSATGATSDPAWLCSLLCVLILSSRVAPVLITDEMERKWWRYVQALLPAVMFSTNISTIQALMLSALHLHNTNHRDACWNLTGTAVRVAFAIGLHRDDVKHLQGPLRRELGKQLWWTLYTFEQMQVSSYDRPSAIGDAVTSTSYPNERIIGFAGHYPQDFMKWSQQLVLLLGSTCRALNQAGTGIMSGEDAYRRPLSPEAGILRDLTRWKENLPPHLRLEVADSLAPSSQRPVFLLHVQFYYIFVLISKPALVRRAMVLSKGVRETLPQTLYTVSETCIDSARSLGRLMRRLESYNQFNAFTWWDIFYTVMSSMVLVLDIICHVKQHGSQSLPDSQSLLRELAGLVTRQLQNPRMPGTMRTWSTVVVELSSIAEQYVSVPQSALGSSEASADWQISDRGSPYTFPINTLGVDPIEPISSDHFNLAFPPIMAGLNDKAPIQLDGQLPH